MQLLISDTNILIDLEEGGLLTELFQLPYQFSIPDILFIEELEEQHAHLLDLGLTLGELTGHSMIYAEVLIGRYRNPSRNDCFALALAKQEECPLLSGDLALRQAADKEAVIVKGTLWVVEQLIIQKIISIPEAKNAYAKMKESDRRLPWELALQRLEKL